MCVCLEEAELQKLLKTGIACAIKEHDNLDNQKPKSHHKRRKGQTKHYGRCILRQQSKQHGGKRRKKCFMITMAFVTMTPPNSTSLNLSRNMFSRRTILWNSRGSGRSGLLKMPKGALRDAA
eukprot:14604124-Ditylum_brightwellii.AAC.1